MTRSLRVVVVGAGVAGLAAALFLARRGHQVQVFEGDPSPTPGGLAEAGAWWRRGTPQATHSHAFLARCREVLALEAPDVLDGLRAAGAREIRLSDTPPATLTGPVAADDRLVLLACRRNVFEWVLRRAVLAEPGVALHAGVGVTGLWLEPMSWSPVRVMGVFDDTGVETPADLVVDAAGRRSPIPSWLADAGAPVPAERLAACGITYYSRFYTLRGSRDPGPLNRGHTAGGSFDRYSCLAFPADNGTFSVTFGVLPEDRALRLLRHNAAFDAAAAAVPLVSSWVQPEVSRPLTRVTAMAGLANRLRTLVADGRPAAVGVLQVGDSACITNPAHTRGTALALLSAARLAQVVDDHPADAEARALAMEAVLASELEPWFHDSVEQDRHRLRRWRPGSEQASQSPSTQGAAGRVSNKDAYQASQRDPEVWAEFTALQHLLRMPSDVLTDAVFVSRVRSVLSNGWRLAPIGSAPSHDELGAILAGVAGVTTAGVGS